MANSDAGFFVQLGAIGTAIGSAVAAIAFWSRLSDRITKAEGTADVALQEAAEAKNDNNDLREAMGEMNRDIDGLINTRSREYGEGLTAIRQHVTELAFFMRDNFVRKEDFANFARDIREGQAEVVKKIDDLRDRLPSSGKHS